MFFALDHRTTNGIDRSGKIHRTDVIPTPLKGGLLLDMLGMVRQPMVNREFGNGAKHGPRPATPCGSRTRDPHPH